MAQMNFSCEICGDHVDNWSSDCASTCAACKQEEREHATALKIQAEMTETFEKQLATTKSGKMLLATLSADEIVAMRDVFRQTAANVAQGLSMEGV